MPQALRFVPPESVVIGWDFSTGGVKCLAFDLDRQDHRRRAAAD